MNALRIKYRKAIGDEPEETTPPPADKPKAPSKPVQYTPGDEGYKPVSNKPPDRKMPTPPKLPPRQQVEQPEPEEVEAPEITKPNTIAEGIDDFLVHYNIYGPDRGYLQRTSDELMERGYHSAGIRLIDGLTAVEVSHHLSKDGRRALNDLKSQLISGLTNIPKENIEGAIKILESGDIPILRDYMIEHLGMPMGVTLEELEGDLNNRHNADDGHGRVDIPSRHIQGIILHDIPIWKREHGEKALNVLPPPRHKKHKPYLLPEVEKQVPTRTIPNSGAP